MRRLQLFEFEDRDWFPSAWRDPLTDWLQDLVVEQDLYAATPPLIADLVADSPERAVFDVCSGGGGPWAELKGRVEATVGPFELTLSDKFPNRRGLARIVERIGDDRTTSRLDSVDATDLPEDATGVITSFSALHHLQPHVIGAVLGAAQRRRQAVALFDMTSRSEAANALRHVPIGAFRALRSRRPRSRSVTLATYVPVLPLAITWDAVVSNLRAYEPAELQAIVDALPTTDWTWDVGRLGPSHGGGRVTYVTGRPRR